MLSFLSRCQLILLQSRSLFLNDQAGLTPAFVISTLEYPMILTILFLACWADPKPRDIALEGSEKPRNPFKFLIINNEASL